MVLRTLLTMGEQHGYGIARRIEQTSEGKLSINYGTLYPALLKLEQEGLISSEWGVSDNNRKAKFYKLTRAGRKQIERDTRQWAETVGDHDALPRGERRVTRCKRSARGGAAVRRVRIGRGPSASFGRDLRATRSCTSTTTSAPA